ncbi:MAG: VWA domain-containing protein [Candidatus Nanopelagicales bacterium]
MTFLSAWRLVLLVAPLALLAAYLLVQRRRQVHVLRFTSLDLLDSVAPRRSGWQRHIPAAAVLGALVVLTLAFAQPAMAVRTPVDRATIMLVLDTSASMTATDVAPTRLAAAEARARAFVGELPDDVQVGIVTFNGGAALAVPPTKDRAQLLAGIDRLEVGGGTATADGIRTALDAIASVPRADGDQPAPAAIVLMSDGTPTIGTGFGDPLADAEQAASDARAAGVPVETIAFGTPDGTVDVEGRTVAVPVDAEAMARIAEASGGRTFTAETADQLGSVYDEIGRDLAYTEKTQDVSAQVAGAGLALALVAAASALVWTQRLV